MSIDDEMQESLANLDDEMQESLADLDVLSPLLNSAVELTKLVIENKLRNKERMEDEDIYAIYQNSLLAIMSSAPLDECED